MLKYLTDGQRSFIANKDIKVGGLYMFPRWGFFGYDTPEYGTGEWIDINPMTKSLDGELFRVSEITENGFVKGNFASRHGNSDFYMLKTELESRGAIVAVLLLILLYIPLVIYNSFQKSNPST